MPSQPYRMPVSSPLSLRVRWAVIGTGWVLGLVSLSLWLLSYLLNLRTMPLGEMPPWRDALTAALWNWCGRFGLGSLFLLWLIGRGLGRPCAADRWGRQLLGHLARAVGVFVTVTGTYWLARQVGHGLGGDAYPLSRLLHPLLEGVLVQDLTFYTAVSLGASCVGRVLEDVR